MKTTKPISSDEDFLKESLIEIYPEEMANVGPNRFKDVVNEREFIDSPYGADCLDQSLEIIDALVKVATFFLGVYALKKNIEKDSEINLKAREKAKKFDQLKMFIEDDPESFEEYLKRLEDYAKLKKSLKK